MPVAVVNPCHGGVSGNDVRSLKKSAVRMSQLCAPGDCFVLQRTI